MTRIATGPNDSTETQPGGVQNNELVFCRELNEWWRIILEISTEIRSPELRTKFLAFANSEREAKDQVRTFNLACLTMQIIELMSRSMHRFCTRKIKSNMK